MNFLNLMKSIIMIELLVLVAVTGRHHMCIVGLMTSPIRMELNLCQKSRHVNNGQIKSKHAILKITPV